MTENQRFARFASWAEKHLGKSICHNEATICLIRSVVLILFLFYPIALTSVGKKTDDAFAPPVVSYLWLGG